jgi:carbon-monoxide dehydrogenase large subunit
MAQGVYRIPRLGYDVAVALTNTAPMGAFRGAGRPEAAEMLERLIDIAADELGLDPVEIRRRNLIQASEFPLTTLTGAEYDSGDYERVLDRAVALSGYEELRAEQAARRERGDRRLLGIGVSTYVEVTAGGGGEEYGQVDVRDDGRATIRVGTSAHGQGHATAFSMIVSDRLGIPMSDIDFIQSDTALVPRGGGTGGSRSLQMGGSAVRAAAETVLQQAR